MKKFIVYSKVDDASKVFIDPIVFSNIILKLRKTISRRNNYRKIIEELIVYSMQGLKENNIVYAKISSMNGEWNIRTLTYGEFLLACIYESKDISKPVIGSVAVEHLTRTLYSENPRVKMRAGQVSLDILPQELKVHVEKCISEKKKNVPPYYWVGKIIYNLKVERIITDKGAYMYVLEGYDIFGKKYAIKVPREKSSDGKPLAIGGTVDSLLDIIRGLMNSLEVALSTRDNIKSELLRRGYSEVIADYLIKYREYILRPRAIVLLRDTYSGEEYSEIPPLVIEDFADMGDLEMRIKKKRFDSREIAYLGIRLAGALALAHANRFIHMDVKPQNILLTTSEKEPYGYKPLLTDFVGVPHLFESTIELKKATPEYADPIALLKGVVTYSFDLYSLGNTLYYAFTGRKLASRILLNLILLRKYYGLASPLKVFLIEHPDLVSIAHRLENIINQYSSKRTGFSDLITSIIDTLADIDKTYLSELRKIPEKLYVIFKKLLELDEEKRYPDAIALWIDMVKVLKDVGYTNLIPHRPF